MIKDALYKDALFLLKQMIATPSLSKEEGKTGDLIATYFSNKGIHSNRTGNNIWLYNKHYDPLKPSILLNSHHDTVKPDPGYTRDPFDAVIDDGKLFGLGSNDAGGCVVSLIAAFIHFYEHQDLRYNLVIALTAEEEISGKGGIESVLPLLNNIEFAIVGEPTLTDLAIAEKGLLVIDCNAQGEAGHAAREEGDNALYNAIDDISWFRSYRFEKVSDLLGAVKMSVTSIHTDNKAHNVVPSSCVFVVDIRINELYTHEEVLEIVSKHCTSTISPRSVRLRSSKIDIAHPLVQAGIRLGKKTYGSPTLSDASLIALPVLKCGPGDSARSHTADEFIFVKEIEEGINVYVELLTAVLLPETKNKS